MFTLPKLTRMSPSSQPSRSDLTRYLCYVGPVDQQPSLLPVPWYVGGSVCSPDGHQKASLQEVLHVVDTHAVRLGIKDNTECASGTLVKVNGHLMVATARHVVDVLFRGPEGQIVMGGFDLSNPCPPPPNLAGRLRLTGKGFDVEDILFPETVSNEFMGETLSHPDVALLKLKHDIPMTRFACCHGAALLAPHDDLICFAAGFPADYTDMCLCANGDDFAVDTDKGVTFYSMRGLAKGQGTLVRASGESKATHDTFGGMSGGGLFVRIHGAWHYAGTVFLEYPRGAAEALYAVAAAEIVRLIP